ncbi:MAG: ABC transporter ATP-binding protein [Aquisalinus sp.]|nr:ABC transporter ATP-binding protein [Aquisalinus sp.]
MTEVKLQNITARKVGKTVLENVNLNLKDGEMVAIVGPNGAGKTSLLEVTLGLLPVTTGSVQINRQNLSHLTPLALAQQVAYLPQTRPMAWPLRVFDTVALGRFAWGGPAGKLSITDISIVNEALRACEIEHLKERQTDQLSGGELARVHFARTLAGQTPILIADEPANALDPKHQLQIMSLLRRYATAGKSVLIVMHDLSLAARYADRLIWLKNGQMIADGTPRETLTSRQLEQIFEVDAEVTWKNDMPVILPTTQQQSSTRSPEA